MTPQPLTADEWRLIELVPPGYQWSLIAIAMIKRALTVCRMTAAERVEMLEELSRFVDRDGNGGFGFVTAPALAAIEPACPIFARIVDEARRLDDPDDPAGKHSYRILISREVLGHLLALNPSLLEAVKLCVPWLSSTRIPE